MHTFNLLLYAHKICVFISIILISGVVTVNDRVELSTSLLNFCVSNGMKFLSFYLREEENKNELRFLEFTMRHSKIENNILRSKRLRETDVNDDTFTKYKRDNWIFVSLSDIKSIQKNLSLISKTKITKSIIVLLDPIDLEIIDKIKLFLRKLSRNTYFYLLYIDYDTNHELVWKRIISVQNNEKVLVQQLLLDNDGKMIEEYNLEGIHIPCLTLSWMPYIDLIECNPDNGKNCLSVGYLADIWKLLGKRLNFTWHCDADPNQDWGVIPVSGPANVSGKWGGVVEKVNSGMYPFSLAQWLNMESRIEMFDFVNVGRGLEYVMALVPKLSKYDSSLYKRPFRNEVWYVIFLGNVVMVVFLIISWTFSHLKFGRRKTNTSFRLVKSIYWMTWLLVISYYGGALKMFFTTEITVPFETQRQCMEAYPDWNMMFRKGNEKLFLRRTSFDTLYKEFWERAEDDPDLVTYSSTGEGIKLIFEDQVVIHTMDTALRQFYNENPNMKIAKTFPSDEGSVGEYLIITDNSPLGPIWSQGLRKLSESGIFDVVDMKWRGKSLSDYNDSNKSTASLSEGQVMLIYAFLSTAIGIAFAVLVGENIFQYMKNNQVTIYMFHIRRYET